MVLDPGNGGAALFVDGDRRYLVLDTLPEALLAAVVGAALVVAAAWAVKGMATAHGGRPALLGPSQSQLQEPGRGPPGQPRPGRRLGRGRARRIERDLHDGAQQRLVALAGPRDGQAKLETDPAAATALVGEAQEAKRALAELRDLARGIHPAVLADRGWTRPSPPWPPARRSPSGRRRHRAPARPGRVDRLLRGRRGPHQRGQHAVAAEIGVRITRHRSLLIVEVIDDGVGGADLARGTGLRGLADRVAAVDGQLAITSPPGGPTVIGAELPCGS